MKLTAESPSSSLVWEKSLRDLLGWDLDERLVRLAACWISETHSDEQDP